MGCHYYNYFFIHKKFVISNKNFRINFDYFLICYLTLNVLAIPLFSIMIVTSFIIIIVIINLIINFIIYIIIITTTTTTTITIIKIALLKEIFNTNLKNLVF